MANETCLSCQAPLLGEGACSKCGSRQKRVDFSATIVDHQHEAFSSPQDPENLTGYEFGRFLIGDRIGVGGMGTVYRAQLLPEEYAVSLKILHPQYAVNPKIVERFFNEAR